MSKKEFVEIISDLKPKLDEDIRTSPYGMLSYFDLTTAIALYYFAKKNVDWAILEVGCGGMYDATNVIPHKDVAVITNVGLDHTHLLGKTKSEIAKRKAGIITGKTNVFTAESSTNIRNIIQKKADATGSTFHCTQVGKYSSTQMDLHGTTFTYNGASFQTSALGEHQVKNAILAIDIASSLNIDEQAIKKGIATAKQPLRMQVISKKPLIILDGAHNPDKISSTISTLQQCNNSTIHIINGFSGNKDLSKMIKSLARLKPISVACTRNTINHFRKVAHPAGLTKLWQKEAPKANIEQFLDPVDAFRWVQKKAKKSDIILVTGSLFLASEIKQLL